MFIIWNCKTLNSFIASCVWNFCEFFHINCGRLAPYLFNNVLGIKGERINERYNQDQKDVKLNRSTGIILLPEKMVKELKSEQKE